MKVAQVKENKIIVSEIDDIKLDGRKGAIVMTLGCGLCGSDIVKFRHKIVHDGAVLGHEIVAEILEINSDTKKTNIFPGGFSEKVFVSEEHLKNVAYLVPENMTDEEISFYEPLGCCIRAIKRCALQKDDTALIVGLGSIGLLMGEGLKAMGYKVYGCDLIPERIELAKKMGIEPFDFSFEVDGVFMTSGADKAIDTALKAVRAGGKILVFSSTPLSNGYPNNEIYYKELTVLGSYSPSPADLKDSFDLLASGKVNVKGLTTVYPLDKIQQAFDDTVANKIFKAYIKIAG